MRVSAFRTCLATATAMSGTLWSNAALADCVSQAPVHPEQIVCDAPGTLGWDGTNANAIVVTVNAGATVNTSAGGTALINAGTGSAVINFSGAYTGAVAPVFGIDAGASTNPAISVGGGSIVTNTSGAAINGTVTFGSATGAATNVLNNNYSSSGGVNKIGVISGAVSATGNFTLNNQAIIGVNLGSNGSVTQTGAGTVAISNGVDGGYAAGYATFFQNGYILTRIGNAITTEGNTSLVNHGGGNAMGGLIFGNVAIGSGGTGNSSIVNGSTAFGNATIWGTVTMSDLNNTITNDGTIVGNVTMNGAGSNTYNAGSSGSSGDNGVRLPGSQVTGAGVPTGTVVGTLTGLAANAAHNTLNLNGIGASTLQAGSSILNFGVVNKNDSGSWLLKNTLDGAAGKLTNVNVTGGSLSTDSAAFLGSAATTVALSNGTTLNFDGAAAGTFAGNIVDASGANTGAVTVTGPNTTTLSGTNTYSGTTTIDGGTLATGSNGALSANSDLTIENGGTLIVNNLVTIKSLADAGTGPNTVNLNGSGVSLTLGSGAFGANGGTFTGTGTLIKSGTGTFDLDGANTVNLTAPGTFQINDGTVNVNVANAIGSTTAVEVNSTGTTTGVLNVDQSDTIGSLAGTGANAQVNIASGMTLDTGGLGTSTTYAGQITGAGALVKSGAGIMTLTGANSYTGGTTINGGAVEGFAGTGASIVGDYNLSNAGTDLIFDQASLPPSGPQSGTYAGSISGVAGTNIQFFGTPATTLTLTGNNSGFLGTMNFGAGTSTIGQGGTVAIGAATNVGTGTLLFYDGVLRTTADMTLANAVSLSSTGGGGTFNTDTGTTLTLSGGVSGAGALDKIGAGTLILAAPSTYTGGTTVSAGTLQGVAGSGIQGDVVNNATVVLTGSYQIYGGDMSGTGNVVIQGVVGLAGTNTYSGTTTVAAGNELGALSPNGLSPNSTIILDGALGDSVGGFVGDQTIGALSGGSTGTVQTAGYILTTGANNASTTFAGQFLAGSGGLVKVGTGTFTLSGTGSTLTGNLGVQGGTLSLTGDLASATTTVDSGATLSVDGTLTSPTVTVAAGGFLVGGLGTTPGNIIGDVTVDGTIAPGHSPGIIAISGSYTQGATGTYVANVGGNGTGTVVAGTDYDRIAVSGTTGAASLAGSLQVVQNGGLYVAGTTYDIITTTGGITGNFTSITGNVISPFITLSNAAAAGGGVVGNDYRLVVVRSAYNTVALNPNQVAVANGLQALVGASGTSATVVKIDNMTAAQAQALFNATSPEPYAAYATAMQDQGELFTRQVEGRIAAIEDPDKTGVWITGYGQWGNGKDKDYRFGSDQRIIGVAGGADFAVSGLRLGVGVGYSEDKVTYLQGNSSGKSKSWQVGGYASYGMGGLHVEAQAAYISGDITTTKLVNAGSGATLITGTASADTKGHLFHGTANIGYDVGTANLKLQPYIGVDFTSGHINGFTETGMGVLDLTVDQIKADRTDLVAGFHFSAPTGSITPYVNAAYRYRVNDSNRTVTAWFDGLSASPFTVTGINSGRSRFDVDAGLSAKVGATASVFVGYQGTFRNDISSHGVNGGLRLSF